MAWNPSPTVADCRDIARKWKCQQVVIVGINIQTDKYEVASYGETKPLCDEAGQLGRAIDKLIQSDAY